MKAVAGQLLLVSVGPYTLAMEASDVRAVSHMDTPGAQSLRRALGVAEAVLPKSRLLLVNGAPPRPVWVDGVQGLRELEAITVQRLPALMQGNPRTPWLLGLGELAGAVLLLVDAKRLALEPQ